MPLAPLYAAEETLEERRERIKRKYLRERTVIYESDLFVEEVSQQDNERIEDSEIMLIEDTTFAKEEDRVPNRMRRPYVVPAQMRAAWMELEEETDADFEEESENKKRYEYQRYENAYGLDRAQQNGNQTLEPTSGYFSKRELFSEQFKFMQQKNLPNQSADGSGFQPAYNNQESQGFDSYQPAWMSPSATGNTGLMSKQDQAEQGSNDRDQRFYVQPEEASYEPSVRAPALQPKIKRWNPASDDQGLNEFIDRNRL
jgi:hypothetical protein